MSTTSSTLRDESAAGTAAGRDEAHRRVPSGRPTLLVVEDDGDYRALLKLCLARLGYDVIEAHEGGEAILKCLTCDADIMLTDIFMPGMDGVDLIREIQLLRPEMPIVAFSGAVRCDQSGVGTCGSNVPLLCKPVDLEQLAAALRRALGEREG